MEAGQKAANEAAERVAKDVTEKAAKDAAERTAEARAKEMIELSKDPAHGAKINPKGVREAEVGKSLEDAGKLEGPLTRDPNPKGGEFIDKHGGVWDVKNPQSKFPKKGKTVVDGAMEDIVESLKKAPPEKVILDSKNLTPTDLADLKDAVKNKGLTEKDVIFFP
jgi:hypothetical protein